MKSQIRLAPVLTIALALVWFVATGQAGGGKNFKPFLPADVYQELLARDSKALQETLAGKVDDDKAHRAQFLAALIAGYTLASDAGNSADRQNARGTAVQIANLAKSGKGADLAAALPKGKPGQGDVEVNAKAMMGELGEMMNFLRLKAKGGEGLPEELMFNPRFKTALNGQEEVVRYLAGKKATDAALEKAAKELELLAYRTAVAGVLTHDFTPAKAVGKKDPAVWADASLKMRDASIELAQAAKKKDGEAVLQAAKRLDASCNQCHNAFR